MLVQSAKESAEETGEFGSIDLTQGSELAEICARHNNSNPPSYL